MKHYRYLGKASFRSIAMRCQDLTKIWTSNIDPDFYLIRVPLILFQHFTSSTRMLVGCQMEALSRTSSHSQAQ